MCAGHRFEGAQREEAWRRHKGQGLWPLCTWHFFRRGSFCTLLQVPIVPFQEYLMIWGAFIQRPHGTIGASVTGVLGEKNQWSVDPWQLSNYPHRI